MFEVQLTLTSVKDNDLRQLIDYIRQETYLDKEGWYRLGRILSKISESTRAQHIYETLLAQTTEESAKGLAYLQLGQVKRALGEYVKSIQCYEAAIEIERKHTPHRDQNFARFYHNLGLTYDSMTDYPQALSSFE